MSARKAKPDRTSRTRSANPFRRAVISGLGILLPPLLTIVIFLWVGNTVTNYLLEPLEDFARWTLMETADIRTVRDAAVDENGRLLIDGGLYRQAPDAKGNKFVPLYVFQYVDELVDDGPMPQSARAIYLAYVNDKWLRREIVIPVFLCLFILVLYLLGKFMAAGVGRFFWHRFEMLIHRVPLVRNVYSSVKQVTDFLFSEAEIEYTRVVAFEYPRKGIWTLGLVTGESMLDIRSAANEPVMSILVPTSPMPFTGFTITVKKSETIDLNITIDQAFQFIVSCGVVVPPQQIAEALASQQTPVVGSLQPPSTHSSPVGSTEG